MSNLEPDVQVMMASGQVGTIVLDGREKWSASSGVFNWVVEFLAGTVEDRGPTTS
jgi:hypothetical protein